MIHICKLFCLFFISSLSHVVVFPFILSFRVISIFYCLSCVPGWLIFFYSTEQAQNSFSFSIYSFCFLIEYLCMLLFDESIEQSLLFMISTFIFVCISFFFFSCLLIFEENLFVVPNISICILRMAKNSYMCCVSLSISLCFSCKQRK